jgi:hypothetical protein
MIFNLQEAATTPYVAELPRFVTVLRRYFSGVVGTVHVFHGEWTKLHYMKP